MIFPTDEEKEGIKRLGLQADAQYLAQYLLKVLLHVSPPGSDLGAVSRMEGQRSLARDLIDQMELRETTHDRKPDALELARNRTGNIAVGQRGIARRIPDGK
jgi:hypothetical protein